jgi:oligopeptide transport system ATP-binding protein
MTTTPQAQEAEGNSTTEENLVQVNNLKVYFDVTGGVFRHKIADIKAVDDITFGIKRGETLGLVGESGSGKTTVGKGILQLIRPTAGEVLFEGVDLTKVKRRALHSYRQRMQVIFQDPYSSLNPRMTAGNIVGEPLVVHKLSGSKGEYRDRVVQLFETVGLNARTVNNYPHEFSGGQRQRIGVARALAMQPDFIVADEPVSALDVSVQAQILNLLEDLQTQFSLTYLVVAHDLSVVRHISDRVAVMYLGKMVELAPSDELYGNPLHPYTKALMSAVPVPDPVIERTRERQVLVGDIPSPINPPSGCVFHTRCPIAIDECSGDVPEFREVVPGHFVACIRV